MTNKEKIYTWIYRILVLLNVLIIISGYISWYQTNYELSSPLIPRSTVHTIINESSVFKASIIASIPFLAGIWLWSFNQKKAAIILLSLSIIAYEAITF